MDKNKMKKVLQDAAEPFGAFVSYIREHRILSAAVFVLLLLVYGKAAYSNDFYVDAEVILNNPRTFYNWGEIGRFGLIAIKCLTGMHWYNPYLAAALFLITIWLKGMCCCCLVSGLGCGESDGANFIFVCLFLIFPTYADQYMFRFQSFEVAFAMLLIVISSSCFLLFLEKKNPAAFVLGALLELFSFGIYQSMVNLQICFYLVLYLFCMEQKTAAERKRQVLWSILHFMTGFVIYELIANLFFNKTSYLADQVGWLSGDLARTVRNLLAYVKHVLLATDVFYPVTYAVCVVGGAGVLLYLFIKKHLRIPALCGIGSVLASPFFLAIVTGTPTIYRAQCMLPFVCASMWLFLFRFLSAHLPRKKRCHALWMFCGGVLLFMQASVLMRMFYTQDVVREADRITAQQIMSRIDTLSDTARTKPIVFTGHLDAKGNGSCYTKEEAASFLSYSLFEYAYVDGVPIETPNYYNTGRILGYFETLGFSYVTPTVEETAQAEMIGRDMDCWPAETSVMETEDFLIIKLSDF